MSWQDLRVRYIEGVPLRDPIALLPATEKVPCCLQQSWDKSYHPDLTFHGEALSTPASGHLTLWSQLRSTV